jgi:hypothetical protein
MLDRATGKETTLPPELQLLFVIQSWGMSVLGPRPDWLTVVRLHRLARVWEAYQRYADPRRGWRKMSKSDWEWVQKAKAGSA